MNDNALSYTEDSSVSDAKNDAIKARISYLGMVAVVLFASIIGGFSWLVEAKVDAVTVTALVAVAFLAIVLLGCAFLRLNEKLKAVSGT